MTQRNRAFQRAIDICLAHRDFVHLAAVWAFDVERCLPSGSKALHIGLDAGGRLLMCCRTGEKQGGHLRLLSLYRRERTRVSQPPTPGAGPLSVMDESLRLIESRVSRKAHYADRLCFKSGPPYLCPPLWPPIEPD